MLSSKNDDGVKSGSKSGPEENARTGSALRRAGLSASLNVPIRTPKAQSLPSYLVKVLLSLVQARLEAQVWYLIGVELVQVADVLIHILRETIACEFHGYPTTAVNLPRNIDFSVGGI